MYYYDSVDEQQYLLKCELYYNFDCNQYDSISEEFSLYNTYFSDEEIDDYLPYGLLIYELRDLLPEFRNVVHLPIECFR